MKQLLVWLPLSLTFVVSPEAQTLLGNSVGLTGVYFYPVLCLVAVLASITIYAYSALPSCEFEALRKHYGVWLPLTLFMSSRLLFFVTASTIVLATSGFVFNEVFFSSFPNFGFAFLILGLVIISNLIGSSFARTVQLLFVTIWFFAMMYLVTHSLIAEGYPQSTGQNAFSYKGLFLPFLLLIGVELAMVQARDHGLQIKTQLIGAGFLGILFILGLWGFGMGKMVSFDILADSFIPHTKSARRLLGEPGRVIIGMAMIAGTFALVNGVLQVLVHEVRGIVQNISSKKIFDSPFFEKTIVVALGCSPGIMMAEGMAGYEITEVYLRGSLIFWMVHYAIINRVALQYRTGLYALLHKVAIVSFIGVSCGLLYFDTNFTELCIVMMYVLLATGCCSVIISRFTNKDSVLCG